MSAREAAERGVERAPWIAIADAFSALSPIVAIVGEALRGMTEAAGALGRAVGAAFAPRGDGRAES